MSFLDELKRRNVIRIAGLYLVGAWLIVQVASTVLPTFDGPGWLLRALITLLAIGFFPALIFAWAFDLTPEGLRREKEVFANLHQDPRWLPFLRKLAWSSPIWYTP